MHEGQKNGRVVSEVEWYGLNEGPNLELERQQIEAELNSYKGRLKQETLDKINAGTLTITQVVPRELRDRSNKNADLLRRYRMRLDAVQFARSKNCASLPSPPCDVYRVITAADNKKIEDEWDAERANYQARYGLSRGEKVNHRVPKSAGGCPTGDGNLVPDSRLSAECLDADKRLTEAQGDAATRWARGGF